MRIDHVTLAVKDLETLAERVSMASESGSGPEAIKEALEELIRFG